MTQLLAQDVTLGYDPGPSIIEDLSLQIPEGRITSIIGPNGCGKSTLLRALARLMAPRSGTVVLDGQAIHSQPTREVAKRLCLLPQQPAAPDTITVRDLVNRGRYPHQSLLQPPSERDRRAVEEAIELAGVGDLSERPVDELSGGQRQRAWIAMALAQETQLLLLDEPTTYLDIAHQQDLFRLIRRLNRSDGRTIAMVVHDINNAAQISDHIVAMRDGRIVAEGAPGEIIQPALLNQVFGIACDLITQPGVRGCMTMPRSRTSSPSSNGEESKEAIRAEHLSTGYNRQAVVNEVSLSIPEGKITAIVGPNACGKSTLLRTLSRLLQPIEGDAYLNGQPVQRGSHRDFAKHLAMLGQASVASPGVIVEDLISLGRYPYQRWYRQWSNEDHYAVERAMSATGVIDLRWRPVDTLSGGQRQRVWIAMALAQDTEVLVLDEPTTFLDIAHQIEVLDLVRELNQKNGRTVVMVLHDLCHACRYADHLIAMRDGDIIASGPPRTVITRDLVREVFDVESWILADPIFHTPLVMPEDDEEEIAAPQFVGGMAQPVSTQLDQ